MAQTELLELLDRVTDQGSFLVFVAALERDRAAAAARPGSPYQTDPGGWENTTIEDFLEAAVDWARASDFNSQTQPGASPWRRFAEFLLAGKFHK